MKEHCDAIIIAVAIFLSSIIIGACINFQTCITTFILIISLAGTGLFIYWLILIVLILIDYFF